MKGEYVSKIFGVITLLLLWESCQGFPRDEVLALQTFKQSIYEDPGRVLSNWYASDGDPCDWYGVICSFSRDHVVKINITGASLKGFIAPELSNILYLQELVLRRNALLGVIPGKLSVLKYLSILDLSFNKLTGPIPPEMGELSSLKEINLQSNGLTGEIPPEIGKLNQLVELRVSRNRLHGTIPGGSPSNFTSNSHRKNTTSSGLCEMSQLNVVDFSYNFLSGSIPDCFESYSGSSFRGNCLQTPSSKQRSHEQCGSISLSANHTAKPKEVVASDESKKHQRTSNPTWHLAIEIVSATLAASLLILAILLFVRGCRNRSSIIMPWKRLSSLSDLKPLCIDPEMLKGIPKFKRQELEVACEDFSNIIGSSPDSVVYKGTMKPGCEIAVISICLKDEQWTGYHQLFFQREVADFARLNHDNVGKLVGYCEENMPFSRMLVFEYASNGTLYEHLHCEGCQFSWSRRMRIAVGIAKGLKYLHTELVPPFTISELNSSSVYFTDDFSPKLLDFESWKSVLARSLSSGPISTQGAICGHVESIEGRMLDFQGNMHAFGVILLELVSGRLPYSEERGCLVEWAKDYLELPEAMSQVVDPELRHFKPEDLQAICEAVSLCLKSNSSERQSMAEVCDLLDSRIDTSVAVDIQTDSLAWAELALSL